MDDQLARAYDQYHARETDILKNSFLQSLKGELSRVVVTNAS